MPVVPATREANEGESLKPMSLRIAREYNETPPSQANKRKPKALATRRLFKR
jgi:hypothetical protein